MTNSFISIPPFVNYYYYIISDGKSQINFKRRYIIENKITETEDLILNKQRVENEQIAGCSLIVLMFDEYNIDVPRDMVMWIKKNLYYIRYSEFSEEWICHYRKGFPNDDFMDYMDNLITAVKEKYNVIDIDYDEFDYDNEEGEDFEI